MTRLFFSTSIFSFILLFLTVSCNSVGEKRTDKLTDTSTKKEVIVPKINKDSVYQFVQDQVDFGSRVPGSEAHKKCAIWMQQKLEQYGAKVTMQNFKAKFHHGQTVDAVNVIGSFNPEKKRRFLLCAHWDSRYIADQDTKRKKEPILGADDGASGVGVLLEIARLISQNNIDLGVDIVMFDAEDQGVSDGDENTEKTWCLGSQYWAANTHFPANYFKRGILLDMVGAKGARFTKEAISMHYAKSLMNKTWEVAKELGYGSYFVDERTGALTDDHKFVNEIANIPTIDIINHPVDRTFGKYWHTHDDNMDVISKNTLAASGNVVLTVLYRYAAYEL